MKIAKLGLLVSAVVLATSAQAGWQGNWLLGVSAGGAWHQSGDDINLTITDGAVTNNFTFNNDNNDDSSFIWGLLAGYQARCNGWLFGAEVNVDWRDNDDDGSFAFDTSTILGPGVSGTISRDNDPVWGFTARIGYEVSCYFMPYIRLGFDYGSRDVEFTAATSALVDNFIVTASNDNDKWGFVGGVGAEFPIPVMAGLSLRAEWNYHSRHHQNDDVAVLAPNGTTLFTFNGDDHRHEQTARASLVFNFPA